MTPERAPLLQLDQHRLQLRVMLDRRIPHLAPNPRHLVPAKRQRRIKRTVAIDPHRTRLDPRNHPVHRRQVIRPDARAKPVGTVIGHAQRIGLIVERNGDQHRPEDLLLHQRMLLIDIDDHRRFDEKSRPELLTAARDGRATFPALFDVPVYALLLTRRDQWPAAPSRIRPSPTL